MEQTVWYTVRRPAHGTHTVVEANLTGAVADTDSDVAGRTLRTFQVCERPQKYLKNKKRWAVSDGAFFDSTRFDLGQLFASPAAFITPRESSNSVTNLFIYR